MTYNRDKHHVFLLNYHIVFCPKRRKKVLVDGVAERLKKIVAEVAGAEGFEVLALEVMADHLHLFVSSRVGLTIPHLVKSVKGKSSRLLRKEFPELLKLPSLWTHSYFVSTAGNVNSETIKKYIEEQNTS